MKVKEFIDTISGTRFYSLHDVVKHFGDDLPFKVGQVENEEYLQYAVATDIYHLEDGFVGVNGLDFTKSAYLKAEECEYICSAKEYIKVTRPVFLPATERSDYV